ncbi:hypothetical protein EJ110_NYTH37923 [Nymphaea thermarum]|nr:hypothetical protein EJ110_NYTH37923 [Nymphaea thermarum]
MANAVLPAVVDVYGTGSNLKGENVPVHVTSIRLNKDNYLSWSAALEIGITSRGRLQYITGEKPAPAKNDPQWATWTLEDSQVQVSVLLGDAAIAINWDTLWIFVGTFALRSVLFVVVLPPPGGLLLCLSPPVNGRKPAGSVFLSQSHFEKM